ncbi:hypothetical protein SAMN04487910_3844 [Aquimarina amphilecti]|uniref:Lipocalin-like domain-containing protein n=1 Tax=Aquimarina amphilecti TaxID=1038014 RepID=A0A1H7US29_AQUAM|nr:hypothetical protein [Aquimarina amphilecti]SEL99495.1 hypothetical protein SAMN04487910_3844 [Aquimarina amphilecti]
MKFLNYISILFLFFVFTSFQITEPKTPDFLYQKWIYNYYQNGNLIYKSKRKFKKDKSGIEFKENGTIIRKQNSGWCGTPPINFEIVSGTWKNVSDSLIKIEYKDWSGIRNDTLQIIELSKSKLILKPIYTLKKQ